MGAEAAVSTGAAEPGLVEQFAAISAQLDAEAGEAPAAEATESESNAEDTANAKPAKADKATKAESEKTEESKAEAKKPPEQDRVLPAERASFRQEKRDWNARREREAQAIASERAAIEAERGRLGQETVTHARSLIDSGDFDGAAKLLGAKNWEDLNSTAAKMFADPGYRESRRLVDELEQLKAEKKREQEAATQRQAEARRQQAEREYVEHVAETLSESEEPALKAFADNQKFVRAVYRYSAQHFRDTREQLPVETAAKEVLAAVRLEFEDMRRRFGVQAAAKPEASARAEDSPDRAGSKEQPARQTKHVTRKGAAASAQSGDLSDEDWKRMAKEEMAKAQD